MSVSMTFGQNLEIDRKTVMYINSIIQKKDVELRYLKNKIQILEIRVGCIEQENNKIISKIKKHKEFINNKISDIEFVIRELKDVLFFKTASQEEITRHIDVLVWLSIVNNRNTLKKFFNNQNNKHDLKKYIVDQIENNIMAPFEVTNFEDDSYSYCEKYTGNVADFDYLVQWLNENSYVLVKILDEENIEAAAKKVIENGFMIPFR